MEEYMYGIYGVVFYSDIDKAIEKAKEILTNRLIMSKSDFNFTIKKTIKGNYSVRINVPWEYLGNNNLRYVTIQRYKFM